MEVLKITLIIIGILLGINIVGKGIYYKIAMSRIWNSPILTDEGKARMVRQIKKENPSHVICNAITNAGIIYLIVFIIVKIVK